MVKPSDFDRKAYGIQLKKERDSLIRQEQPLAKNQKKNKADSTNSIGKSTNSIKIKTDTIAVKIMSGKAKIDTTKSIGQDWVFLVDSDTASKLLLKLSASDSISALAITQIIDPKDSITTPNSKDYLYEVKEKGIYRIIVSEKQPTEKPWEGKFRFEVKLNWR